MSFATTWINVKDGECSSTSGNAGGSNEAQRSRTTRQTETPESSSPSNSNGSADSIRPAMEASSDCPLPELADSMAIPIKQQPSAGLNSCAFAGQSEQTSRPAVEAHGIRVLTPSEIMRTLPSIGHAAVPNHHQPLQQQRVAHHEPGHGQQMTHVHHHHHQQQAPNQLATVRIRAE